MRDRARPGRVLTSGNSQIVRVPSNFRLNAEPVRNYHNADQLLRYRVVLGRCNRAEP